MYVKKSTVALQNGGGEGKQKELYQPTVGLAENREREPMLVVSDPSRFLCTFVPGPPILGVKSQGSK